MATQLTATTYTYNPITQVSISGTPWAYYYVSDISISDSNSYYYSWTNSTGATIPSVYIVIVGEGGVGVSKYTIASTMTAGGSGGSGGGQVSLFQFNNVQPTDFIQVNYNVASSKSSYCVLSYFRNDEQINLTQIGACYYNTPDYATGTDTSTITFNPNLFSPILSGNELLINNNTNIQIFYGWEGTTGTSFYSSSEDGGDGGDGGGGSGGGGGQYTYAGTEGTNGSRGTQNYNSGSYGGMKGGSSNSSDCRDGGYTPLCMPDGTGTPLLGNAGSGNTGYTGSSDSNFTVPAGESGASGSIMVFYPTN